MPVKPRRDNIAISDLANCSKGHIAPKRAGGKGCAECHRLFQLEWRKNNAEKAKQSVDAWRAKNREHCRAYTKAWDAKNPGIRSVVNAAYYEANAERLREKSRKWHRENPEKAREQVHRRLARIKQVGGSHTAQDLKAIFEAQKGKCAYCKTNLRKLPQRQVHLDHIKSIADGGSNDRGNLQFTCRRCNQKKNRKDPIRFAQEMGMLL